MKMVSRISMLLCVVLLSMHSAYAWGGKGHGVIGYIADENLTPKARKMCYRYLGSTLSSNASWMDKVRYTDEYHHTARWHSVGVRDGELVPSQLTGSKARYDTPMQQNDHGVARLNEIVEQMKEYRNLSDSAVVANLKFMTHIVGDLHCPGHTFFADQSMQYRIKVGGKSRTFHGFIDGAYNYYNKGVTYDNFYEQNCRLTKAERRRLCQGDMESWLRSNFPLYRECYVLLPAGGEYDDLSEAQQLRLKEMTNRLYVEAGYRLAHIINEIFK